MLPVKTRVGTVKVAASEDLLPRGGGHIETKLAPLDCGVKLKGVRLS